MATVKYRAERTPEMRESVTRDVLVHDLQCVRMVDGTPQLETVTVVGKYHPREFSKEHKDLTVITATPRKVFCYMPLDKFYQESTHVTSQPNDNQNERGYEE